MLKILQIIANFINICFIWLLLCCLAFVLFILLEIPIPFLSNFANNYIQTKYPQFFKENNYINVNSISLGWNSTVQRPIIIVKNVDYVQDDIVLNFNSVGFYPSIIDLINNGDFSIIKLYINGVNLDFSSVKSNNSKSIEDFFNFINNNPYNQINNFISLNSNLSKLNQIAANNLQIITKYKTDTVLFNIDLIDVSFNAESKIYFAKLNTQVAINNNQLNLGNIKLESSLFINNSFLNKIELNNINLAEIYNYAGRLNVFENNNFLKNLQINNLSFNINGEFSYLKQIEKADFNFYLSPSFIDFSKSLVNIVKQPTNINYAKFNINYNYLDNIIVLNNFEADFKSFLIENKNLNTPISVKKLQYQGSFNLNNQAFSLNGSNVIGNLESEVLINIATDTLRNENLLNKNNLSKQLYNVVFKASIAKIPYNFVLNNWPKLHLISVKNWVKDNISTINIDKLDLVALLNYDNTINHINFNDIKINLNTSNVELNYLQGMPFVQADKAFLQYSNNITSITYQNAKTGNLDSAKGEVKFFNNNDNLMLALDLNVKGSVDNILNYIDNKPLLLVKSSGLNKNLLSGNALGNVYFLYNLSEHKIQDLLVNTKLTNFSYEKVFKDINLINSSVDLIITLKNLQAKAQANYLSNKLDINVFYNFLDEPDNKFKYTINAKDLRISDIEDLNILPEHILNMFSSITELNLVYFKEKDKTVIDFKTDFTKSIVNLEYLNFIKLDDEPFFINGTLQLDNDNFTIDNLNILGDNILGNASIKHFTVKDDIGVANKTNIVIKKLQLKDKANIFGEIGLLLTAKNQNSINVNLKGSVLDVSYFINYYQNNSKNSKVSSPSSLDNLAVKNTDLQQTNKNNLEETSKNTYNIKINVAKIIQNYDNKNYSANNFNFQISSVLGNLNTLVVNANFNSSKDSYVLFDSLTNQLSFKINNAGYFLEMFNLSKDINNGELNGEVKFDGNLNLTTNLKGQILLHDFSAGIPFANANIKFNGNKDKLNITYLVLDGNILGGNLNGYFDYKNQQLLLKGTVAPVPSAFGLVINLPGIKQLLKITGLTKLTTINTEISGNLGNLKYNFFTSSQ